MGVLDKLLDAVKLNDDEYDDAYLGDDDEFLDDIDDDEDFLDSDSKPRSSLFSKFTSKVKRSDDLDDFDDEEPVSAKSAKKEEKTEKADRTSSRFSFRSSDSAKAAPEKTPRASSKITPMRSSRRNADTAGMEVCVIKPTSMEDTREIADTLLDNSTVILNLEGIDVELAQRITDFSSGACYSLGGRLQRISSYIFVMVPYNVDITGDLQNVLGGTIPSVRAGY